MAMVIYGAPSFFRLSTHFLQIEGNGKEGTVHFDLVFSKMSGLFVAVVSLHLSKDRLWFDAPTTSMLYSNTEKNDNFPILSFDSVGQ